MDVCIQLGPPSWSMSQAGAAHRPGSSWAPSQDGLPDPRQPRKYSFLEKCGVYGTSLSKGGVQRNKQKLGTSDV